MRILYHHRIASKDGQYVHVEELTNAFKEQGHTIDFVCPEFSKETSFGNEGGIAKKLKAMLPRAIYEILELGYSFLIAFKLIRQILNDRPDFIYERYNLYQPAGVIVAKLFNLPILMEVNAPLVDERTKYSGLSLKRFARVIEKFTWRHATFVLPVTQVLGHRVHDAGVPYEKIKVIHNGINQNIYKNLSFSFHDKKESQNVIIGFTGFINPWHKLGLAIDVISELKNQNVHLLCVGEGEIRPELEEQAKQLGIADKVTFTGLVTRDKVFGYVSTFDIALQPAVTEYASPLKLFEYLAVGSLVVAPDMPNIREVLDEKNSILFDPNNTDDFKEKLIFSLKNLNQLGEIRKNAYQTIINQGFTWQENATRIISLLKTT